MGLFFTGWELWQDMTFVLACCIVLVFVVGVARLWWTNRTLRKHEVIEEERRARLVEMRHCGIDALRTAEIPFGVRALESGLEVEGIWVSRSNTPDGGPAPRARETMAATTPHHDGAGTSTPPAADALAVSSCPATARPASMGATGLSPSDAREAEPPGAAARPRPRSYMAAGRHDGLYDGQQGTHQGRSACTPSPSGAQPHLFHPHHVPGDAALYGAARVYANRSTRASGTGFEVLPAGVLGPRQELLLPDTGADERNGDPDVAQQPPKQGQSKLRKKPR